MISASLVGQVSDWHVVEGMVSMSDHKYIFFRVSRNVGTLGHLMARSAYPRWSLKSINKPLLNSLLELKCKYRDKDLSMEEMAGWLATTMKEALDWRPTVFHHARLQKLFIGGTKKFLQRDGNVSRHYVNYGEPALCTMEIGYSLETVE